MATYQLKHTGQEIDAAVDWLKNSSSTAENKIDQHTLQIAAINEAIGTPDWFSENNTSVTEQFGNHSNLLTKHGNALNGLGGLNNFQVYDLTTPELLSSSREVDKPSMRFWKSGHFVYVEINCYYSTNSSAAGGVINFQTKLLPQLIPVWNVFMLNAQGTASDKIHENIYFDEQGNIYGWGFNQAQVQDPRSVWCTAMYLTANLVPLRDENGNIITGDTYDKWFETHPL